MGAFQKEEASLRLGLADACSACFSSLCGFPRPGYTQDLPPAHLRQGDPDSLSEA